MHKKKIGTILFLIMTIGLLAAVAYFSFLLNDKSGNAPTQIKKTKASAQTYHKLLALNVTPVPQDGENESSSLSSSSSSIASKDNGPSPAAPTATPPLLAYNAVTPTSPAASPTPFVQPTSVPTTAPPPTQIPSPTVPLLAYRTLTPTLIPIADTGGDEVKPPPTATSVPKKATAAPTKAQKPPTDKLPETGWVQFSSILFIVAAATVFVSFLF